MRVKSKDNAEIKIYQPRYDGGLCIKIKCIGIKDSIIIQLSERELAGLRNGKVLHNAKDSSGT